VIQDGLDQRHGSPGLAESRGHVDQHFLFACSEFLYDRLDAFDLKITVLSGGCIITSGDGSIDDNRLFLIAFLLLFYFELHLLQGHEAVDAAEFACFESFPCRVVKENSFRGTGV